MCTNHLVPLLAQPESNEWQMFVCSGDFSLLFTPRLQPMGWRHSPFRQIFLVQLVQSREALGHSKRLVSYVILVTMTIIHRGCRVQATATCWMITWPIQRLQGSEDFNYAALGSGARSFALRHCWSTGGLEVLFLRRCAEGRLWKLWGRGKPLSPKPQT